MMWCTRDLKLLLWHSEHCRKEDDVFYHTVMTKTKTMCLKDPTYAIFLKSRPDQTRQTRPDQALSDIWYSHNSLFQVSDCWSSGTCSSTPSTLYCFWSPFGGGFMQWSKSDDLTFEVAPTHRSTLDCFRLGPLASLSRPPTPAMGPHRSFEISLLCTVGKGANFKETEKWNPTHPLQKREKNNLHKWVNLCCL